MADDSPADWRELETFSFGDNPALADELADLVLRGFKRATCWAASQGSPTHVGKRMVMLGGSGRPRAVIETVELTQRRFGDVDQAFAFDEGEGDRSLAYWREAHRTYFRGKARSGQTCCSTANASGSWHASTPSERARARRSAHISFRASALG